MQKKYKITISYTKDYYYDIILKELDHFVREAEKLQGTKVEVKELPVHGKISWHRYSLGVYLIVQSRCVMFIFYSQVMQKSQNKAEIAARLQEIVQNRYYNMISNFEGKLLTFLESIAADKEQREAIKTMARTSLMPALRNGDYIYNDALGTLYNLLDTKYSEVSNQGSTKPNFAKAVDGTPLEIGFYDQIKEIVDLID